MKTIRVKYDKYVSSRKGCPMYYGIWRGVVKFFIKHDNEHWTICTDNYLLEPDYSFEKYARFIIARHWNTPAVKKY